MQSSQFVDNAVLCWTCHSPNFHAGVHFIVVLTTRAITCLQAMSLVLTDKAHTAKPRKGTAEERCAFNAKVNLDVINLLSSGHFRHQLQAHGMQKCEVQRHLPATSRHNAIQSRCGQVPAASLGVLPYLHEQEQKQDASSSCVICCIHNAAFCFRSVFCLSAVGELVGLTYTRFLHSQTRSDQQHRGGEASGCKASPTLLSSLFACPPSCGLLRHR